MRRTVERGFAPGFPQRLARPLLVLALLAVATPAMSAEKVYPRVEPLLSASRTIIGEKIAYPTGAPAKVTAVIVTLKPGEETGWHTHGVPVFGYILEGELTVDYGPHGKRVYRKGDSLAEAIHAPHDGRNTGTGITRVLAVFMGAQGRPNTVPAKRPK